MQWTKPDFEEISLCMEVTGYVNTDEGGNEEIGMTNDEAPMTKE